MSIEFFKTGMGHVFFEVTMPSLVKELRRLNDNLEKLTKLQEDAQAPKMEIKINNVEASGEENVSDER